MQNYTNNIQNGTRQFFWRNAPVFLRIIIQTTYEKGKKVPFIWPGQLLPQSLQRKMTAPDPGRTLNPQSEQMGQGESAPPSASGSNTGQRQHGQGACRGQQQEQSRAPRFDGWCKELSGHINNYVNPWKAVDQYMKTTHEIWEYNRRTSAYGEDTKVAIETLAMPTLTVPEDPADDTTCTEVKIWEEHEKQRMRSEDAFTTGT